MLLKSILPDYKSKNFGIVNKLNKNSFTNDNTDFIEFQCEKNKKYSIDPLENPKENFIDLKMKSKFFEKINTIFKNRYCQYFESFTRNLYQISKKMDHLNTSTMDTNFSSLENRKSIEKNYKKYCACVFLIHLIDHKSKESKIYYFQKIKHSNELKLLKKQFAAKIEEKDRMHEQVCENYEEMLGVERENSERLYKINIAQNNSLDSKKITMKKKPLEIRKNPKKNEILTLFNNYQDKILANYEIELKNKEEIQKIIIINEKNKLLLYDLVIDLINKFEN